MKKVLLLLARAVNGWVDIRNDFSLTGRALAEYSNAVSPIDLTAVLKERCSLEDANCRIIEFDNQPFYAINPDGTVELCAGIDFPGSIKEMGFNRLISKQHYCADSFIGTLQAEGFSGLLDLVQRKGFVPDKKYISKCQLCSALKSFIDTSDGKCVSLP